MISLKVCFDSNLQHLTSARTCLKMSLAWPLVLLCAGRERLNFITSFTADVDDGVPFFISQRHAG